MQEQTTVIAVTYDARKLLKKISSIKGEKMSKCAERIFEKEFERVLSDIEFEKRD